MSPIDVLHLKLPFARARMLLDPRRAEGLAVGRKPMTTLVRRMGFTPLYRKLRKNRKAPGQTIWTYLLRTLAITRSNQVGAMAISYIPIAPGFVYLAAVIDWNSGRVLTWHVAFSKRAVFCTEAVEEAIGKYRMPEMFNTDQGSRLTGSGLSGLLLEHGIRISLDAKGRGRDNVLIERLWRSIKGEEVYLHAKTR